MAKRCKLAITVIIVSLFSNLYYMSSEVVGADIECLHRIKIETNDDYKLIGIIEELRNCEVDIPERLDQLQEELCNMVNVGRANKTRSEAKKIIESLNLPMNIPNTYETYNGIRDRLLKQNLSLKVIEATHFLEDKVLGVGLKSYPYVVDWNGDGKKDLLVGDHDGFIYIYLNKGEDNMPVFDYAFRLKSESTGIDFLIFFNPQINLADLDGDGKNDLILGSHPGTIFYVPNIASNLKHHKFDVRDYQKLRSKSGIIDVGKYAYPDVVDFDNDGKLDLIVGEQQGAIYFFKGCNVGINREKILFHDGAKIENIKPVIYPCPRVVDWNGDKKKDLLIGCKEGVIWVYLNVGSDEKPQFKKGKLLRDRWGKAIDVGWLSHLSIIDWNNDKKSDLILGNDEGEVLVYSNIGTRKRPSFGKPKRLLDGGGEMICGVHPIFNVVDWNGDGKKDLIVGGESKRIRVYINKGTNAQPRFDYYFYIHDLFYDKKHMCGADHNEVKIWNNRGLKRISEFFGGTSPFPIDWDNDGKVDLLLGGYTGLIYFFRNEGSVTNPRFKSPRPLRLGKKLMRVAGFSNPVVTDWNEDGKKDIVCSDFLGRVHIFLNVGTDSNPKFDKDRWLKVGGKDFYMYIQSIVEVTDYNGDGKKDLLLGARRGDLYFLENVGTNAEPKFSSLVRLKDRSQIWKTLYQGGWVSPLPCLGNWKRPNYISDLRFEGTCAPCPRYLDWDEDGKKELLIAQRYGRIFVFEKD